MKESLNIRQEDLQQQQRFKDTAVGEAVNPDLLSDELVFLDKVRTYREDMGESDYGC